MPSTHRRGTSAIGACLALMVGLLATTPAGPAGAQEDSWGLDDSFGTGGEVTTKFGSGFDEIFDIAIASDGKIVAVGDATLDGRSDSDFAVARYHENGALDETFGVSGNGMITEDFAGDDDHAGGVAIAPDGRIVVVGSMGNPNNGGRPRLALAIFSSNGTPITRVQFEQFGVSQANTVAIYPADNPNEGKIVLAGYARDLNNVSQFLVVRLMPDGSFDPSFGGGTGYVMPSRTTASHSMANGVAITRDNRIVVAGTLDQAEFSLIGDSIGLIRFTVDGSPDTTFGGVGTGWAAEFPCTCAGWGVGIRADGAIIVAGQSLADADQGGMNMVGWRYSGAGFVKTSLGADFFGRTDVARDVVFQPGKIVLVGWTAETGDGSTTNDLVHFALARFNNSPESVDNTFGNNDYKVTAAFAFGYDAALAGAVTKEGDIVAAGGSNQAGPGQQDIDFALARFTGTKGTTPFFTADVYHLKPFMLNAAPDTFKVQWRAEGEPGLNPKFDLRSREARYDETKLGPWKTVVTKTTARSKNVRYTSGRTVCFSVRGHSGGYTTPWSDQKCTSVPVDDRTLDKQPASAWGAYKRDDCYKKTYLGNGGGTGANLHLEAAFKDLAIIVGKGPGYGALEVSVNGEAVKTIELQAPAIKCGVLVKVKSYSTAPRRDVDIEVVKQGKVGSFVDGVGVSLI